MPVTQDSIWRSPFRPLFLLGALYGLLLMLSWVPFNSGLLSLSVRIQTSLPALWHQHEMVFGFSAAIIFGFILTALPSWAQTREIRGTALLVLVLSWISGRCAIAMSALLPLPLVATLDLGFPVLFVLFLGRDWFRLHSGVALSLFVISASFILGNFYYYLGLFNQDMTRWQLGLRLGLYAMIFHCSVTVGILAPIFTETALQEKGLVADVRRFTFLEWLSAVSIIVLAALDLTGASPALTGVAAVISCVLHVLRMSFWRTLRILQMPIVWVLHLGYAWLVIALALQAFENFGIKVGVESWVHAFTVGGFGLMSLGFMTRVSLRHTGRELNPPRAMVFAYLCLAAAAFIRIAVPIADLDRELLLLSAVLWLFPYAIYLALFAGILIAPSLPE